VSDQAQLPGVCWTCLGAGMVPAVERDRHSEPVTLPALCPDCRPHPARRETWLAAVELARRLAAQAPADGRSVVQDGRSRPPA
jgi:hypothetical protein